MARRGLGAATPAVALALAAGLATAGCGASRPPPAASDAIPAALILQSRPIGHAVAFHPPARGPVPGACRSGLGARNGAHVELFARNRVVLVAEGIGVRGPVARSGGRITGARCYGDLATLEPTGVVLVRPDVPATLDDLFRAWGQTLTGHRLLSFGGPVRVYVDGRPRPGPPGTVPLGRHAEIVVEVGPYVPPHRAYHFPPGA